MDEESLFHQLDRGGSLFPSAPRKPRRSRLYGHWIGTVLDRGAEAVNCISEGGAEPDAQYVEKLNRLTAESRRKRGLQDFG
jgi:hypothetical protein